MSKYNFAFIDDDVLKIAIYEAGFSDEDLDQFNEDIKYSLKKLRGSKNVLIDLTEMDTTEFKPLNFRKKIVKHILVKSFDKAAIVGGKDSIKTVINALQKLGVFSNLKFFDSEQEAIEWLLASK